MNKAAQAPYSENAESASRYSAGNGVMIPGQVP